MNIEIIFGFIGTFIAGGGLMTLINAKTSKKHGEVEVKVDEIGALHDIIEKVLTSLSGTVKKDESDEGSFNGYLVGDKLKYNFSDVPTDDLAAIAAFVQLAEAEAKKAIQAVN